MAIEEMMLPINPIDELALRAKMGSSDAQEELFKKYRTIIIKMIKKKGLYLPRSDDEDLVQEGLIGLFQALKRYEPCKDFHRFAVHCIYRQMVTALKAANCKKHYSLNSSTSLDAPCFKDELEKTHVHYLAAAQSLDPIEHILHQEYKLQAQLFLQTLNLTWLELKVLKGIVKNNTYECIANENDISRKAVDNAVQRIKNKAKKGSLSRKHKNKTAKWNSLEELGLAESFNPD